MLKMFLNDFCECNNSCLLYMGDYTQRGSSIKSESYPINCYYCSKCGKELQVYRGYHDQETKKLYEESLKYFNITRDSSFVFDVTKFNSDIFLCSLEEKRNLVYDIKNKNGIGSPTGLQAVLTFKRQENK